MQADEAMANARVHLRANRPGPAAGQLFLVVQDANLPEQEYDEASVMLAQALSQAGLPRAAATVFLYLHRGRDVAAISDGQPMDLARAYMLDKKFNDAAKLFREARAPAHAAIAYERAENYSAARVLWDEVSENPRLRDDPYVGALVAFNLGRVLHHLGDEPASHRCRVRATRLLEEAADVLEARGLRDRAFDCFQVLLTLGMETGSYENLAEGYLNCIRVLRQDHLKYYALQYYEDFIRKSETSGEHHAVATILHEMADYARAIGQAFHGTLRQREARAWQRASEHIIETGGAAELAENALLAAIGAYTAIGLHANAVQLFKSIAALPLEEDRVKRYERLFAKYADAPSDQASLPQQPDYLRQPVQYPDIWNVDVVEWENQGDAVETCGEILLDDNLPNFTRRKALVARLTPLMEVNAVHPTTLAVLAERLGSVQCYAVLSPLEALFERGPGNVRVSTLRAARMLFFKRTFVLIQRGVTDGDPAVRHAAQEAIGALHFPHAFDPLSRLHRDSVDADVRRSALRSIGQVRSLEAVEYLLGVVVSGTGDERGIAAELLINSDVKETRAALTQAIETAPGDTRRLLEQIRNRRGGL